MCLAPKALVFPCSRGPQDSKSVQGQRQPEVPTEETLLGTYCVVAQGRLPQAQDEDRGLKITEAMSASHPIL